MIFLRAAACAMFLLCAVPSEAATLRVIEGTTSSGHATDLWLTMIQTLRSADPPANAPKILTASEREWTRLIQSRTAQWQSEIPSLARNFRGIDAPAEVRIVVGNRDGEDAFTHDATTIGFDVSRLASLYGDATLPENADRMDRFFRHEYVHLLQKAWLIANPYTADTPLRAALLAIWKEGLGNYYSLSDRWRTPAGEPSATARQTLSELEPRFVARLAALACAPPSSAGKLTADLSMGAFDRKWGALPVALWLDNEVRRTDEALRQFVSAGPDGIWTLAERHLREDAPAVLREIRATAALCHSP
jgi:hypothetical protein